MKAPLCLAMAATIFLTHPAAAQEFTYNPPGQLVSGSGTGRVDETVYIPGMRFPIEQAPAYPNSQVWGVGGFRGPAGGQCDIRNFSYPWSDNFCETRQWDMPLCPGGTGHQGQDIRAASCVDKTHWVVAPEDGQIAMIGSYSVYLVTDSGTQHRFLHMDGGTLAVTEGQRVASGDKLGLVSNNFGGTPTTIHVHYDINQFSQEAGAAVYIPPYMSLVRAYERLIDQPTVPCAVLPAEGGVVDDYGPCFVAYGNPQFWREETSPEANEGKFHWTNGFVNENPSNWARWRLFFAEAGRYRVEFNIVPGFNVSKKVRYSVKAGEVEDVQIVDQSAVDSWFELGVFDFVADPEALQYVDIYDNTGDTEAEQRLTADAIRITRLETEVSDMGTGFGEPDMVVEPDMMVESDMGARDMLDSDAGPESGEVSTSSGCCATLPRQPDTPWTTMFVLVGIWVLRRRRLRS